MTLRNVQFIRPLVIGGISRDGVSAHEGHIEEGETFPQLIVRFQGAPPKGTTWFNIAGWDWVEPDPLVSGEG